MGSYINWFICIKDFLALLHCTIAITINYAETKFHRSPCDWENGNFVFDYYPYLRASILK